MTVRELIQKARIDRVEAEILLADVLEVERGPVGAQQAFGAAKHLVLVPLHVDLNERNLIGDSLAVARLHHVVNGHDWDKLTHGPSVLAFVFKVSVCSTMIPIICMSCWIFVSCSTC